MVAVAQNTNQNLEVGEVMDTTIGTENGLAPFKEETINDTMTAENKLTDFQKQQKINKVAKDSLFDGTKTISSNGNGEVTESDEIDTTKVVTVDDTLIDNLLPIEKVNKSNDLSDLTKEEKVLRETLLVDLENAQFYTVVTLYHYVKVGKKLLDIKKQRANQKGSLKRIIQSIGMNDRTAFRYMKIAKDERFLNMDKEQFKSLHHLTQSKMMLMTEFKDKNFYEAINDEDYIFPKKKKKIEMGDDIEFDKALYETFKEKPKDYIINEYNTLYIQLIELENKIKELEVK